MKYVEVLDYIPSHIMMSPQKEAKEIYDLLLKFLNNTYREVFKINLTGKIYGAFSHFIIEDLIYFLEQGLRDKNGKYLSKIKKIIICTEDGKKCTVIRKENIFIRGDVL